MSKHDFLNGLGSPAPPDALRERTLVAAYRAAAARPSPIGWRAVYEFFAAQPAWTATLVALLLAHLALGPLLAARHAAGVVLPRAEEVAAQPDLLRLPRITSVAGIDLFLGEGDGS